MNWTLLHKYLSGESTEEEKRQVDSWIESDPRNEEFMDSLIKIWEVKPGEEIEVDARAAWETFKHKLTEEQRTVSHEKGTNIYALNEQGSPHYSYAKKSRGYKRAVAISVSAAAVFLVAFLFYQFSSLAAGFYADSSSDPPKVQEIITERGQRTNLLLFDGTSVQLNAESRIRIPPGFGDSTRIVHLEGQAYFDVTHKPDMPFVVHSGNTFTKVLGTKFDVKAYPGDKQVQVVVEEGKVSLSNSRTAGTDNEDRRVNKGQIGLLKEDGRTVVSNTMEIERYLGWKDGRLIFDSTTLDEAIQQLERWYDISIVLADPSVKSEKLTASFKNEPMTEVMNIISLSLDLYYEREGRTFTFYSN